MTGCNHSGIGDRVIRAVTVPGALVRDPVILSNWEQNVPRAAGRRYTGADQERLLVIAHTPLEF